MALQHSARRTRTVSHLLLAGHNPVSPPASYSHPRDSLRQTSSNPSLHPVPFSTTWLASIGREVDTFHGGNRVTSVASGYGHALVAYRNWRGTDRVVAVGRNEHAQLGLGFASQEPTRGLVEGFEGDAVLDVQAGVESSYLVVRQSDGKTALFTFGNLSRGRLAHPNLFPPSTPLEPHEAPSQHSLPRATKVVLPDELDLDEIQQVECGFEHVLVLTRSGTLYGSGCNTDSQLAIARSLVSTPDVYALTPIPLPVEITDQEGGVELVRAGADTSALVTKSGKLYTWGNSEYAQACHSRKIDQIHSPLSVLASSFHLGSSDAAASGPRRIVDYRCGGSFGVVLDDRQDVYTTGFGALGRSSVPDPRAPTRPSSSSSSRSPSRTLYDPVPTRIDALSGLGITRIRAGYGYACAISDHGRGQGSTTSSSPCSSELPRLWTWGLNNPYGRLGVGISSPTLRESRRRVRTSENGSEGIDADLEREGKESNEATRESSVTDRIERHVYEPREVEIPLERIGIERRYDGGARHDGDDQGQHEPGRRVEPTRDWALGDVELGQDTMWVVVDQTVEVPRDGEAGLSV